MKVLLLVLLSFFLLTSCSISESDLNSLADEILPTELNQLEEIDIVDDLIHKTQSYTEPEVVTKTEIITIQANSLQDWKLKINAAEDALIPLGNYIVFNANGEQEYRGYMIVGKEVLEYQKIEVEMITAPSLGNQETETIYIHVPSKIKYTLHKHELENKFTASAIGRFLTGLVNMQIVATQTCNCGYTSQIEWEIPDITSTHENKVTCNEYYIKTKTPVN